MKVYFDTNVLVSAFATRGLCADVIRLVLSEHELVTGEVNISELRRVLLKRFRVPKRTVDAIEDLLRGQTVIARPEEPLEIPIRDPDDMWVLASAVAGGADVLVTGDRDLLEVAKQSPIPIVDARGFWRMVQRTRKKKSR